MYKYQNVSFTSTNKLGYFGLTLLITHSYNLTNLFRQLKLKEELNMRAANKDIWPLLRTRNVAVQAHLWSLVKIRNPKKMTQEASSLHLCRSPRPPRSRPLRHHSLPEVSRRDPGTFYLLRGGHDSRRPRQLKENQSCDTFSSPAPPRYRRTRGSRSPPTTVMKRPPLTKLVKQGAIKLNLLWNPIKSLSDWLYL